MEHPVLAVALLILVHLLHPAVALALDMLEVLLEAGLLEVLEHSLMVVVAGAVLKQLALV